MRLKPTANAEWFIELLAVPASPSDLKQKWVRVETSAGHFGLCSFGFLALANYKPITTPMGIAIAQPELMALANLLEHPEIRPETMSGLIAARQIKRSNKDLGRVLAIARLSIGRDEDALLEWPEVWREALEDRFPHNWKEFARRCGKGLRQLLASRDDFEEATHTCVNGLLASRPPTTEQLRIVGQRIMQDSIDVLERMGAG